MLGNAKRCQRNAKAILSNPKQCEAMPSNAKHCTAMLSIVNKQC